MPGIRRFKDRPRNVVSNQKKSMLSRKMTIYIYGHFSTCFVYNLHVYIFVWIQHGCLAKKVLALVPSNNIVKMLWCTLNDLC